MKKILAPVLAVAILATVGCTWLQSPVGTVPPAIDQTVQTQFTTADLALIALSLIPGIPPGVVTEAKAFDVSLQAAWKVYQSDPTATNEVALTNGILAKVQTFLNAQAKAQAKALHYQG